MKPQDYCCLPWCGVAPGGSTKRAKIGGEWVEYPQLIDFHHTRGRSNPEGIYICHECHMKHHDGRLRIEHNPRTDEVRIFSADGGNWWRRIVTPNGLESA